MDTNEIFDAVESVLRDILDSSDLVISRETNFSDLEGWDSLVQISLYSALEKEFSIKFTISEMKTMQSVSNVIALLGEKL